MEKKEVKILVLGDSVYTSTGYGTVHKNIWWRIAKARPDWKIYFIDWQSRAHKHNIPAPDYKIKPEDIGKTPDELPGIIHLPMGKKEYGYDAVEEHLPKIMPDYLVTLSDVGYQSGYVPAVMKARQSGWRGKWVAYTPIDTEGWAWTWDEVFNYPDINVAMAKFGEQQMKAHKVKDVVLIPHGVDINTFKPLPQRELMREHLKVNDKFVVGFVGRNQRRKLIDRLMATFANFAKDKDDVLLFAHTDIEPPADGWSIPYLLELFKLNDKVRLTKTNLNIEERQKVSADMMNDLMNIYDVFLYTTGGEGFGLPGIECQASGVPLLMSDSTTAIDLCREENRIPILIDNQGRKVIDRGANGVYFTIPDDIKGAELLEKYYKLWKEKKIDREEPRQFALNYDWEKIVPLWIKLFEENQ